MLLSIVLTLIVVGILMYAINSFIPMEPRIKSLLNAVVLIVVVIWILQTFGVFEYLGAIHTPRLR